MGIVVYSARHSFICNEFCFESGCFVYHMNVLCGGNFQIVNIIINLINLN